MFEVELLSDEVPTYFGMLTAAYTTSVVEGARACSAKWLAWRRGSAP